MEWEVEYTDEFEDWWNELDEGEPRGRARRRTAFEQFGPTLKYPHSSDIKGSKHTHLRELRIQHAGQPFRVLDAFDLRRVGVPVNRREQDRR